MKFNELDLPEYIMRGLEAQGFDTPTEIQSLALPLIKTGRDVIGLSQTGSGKTYAFGIPALERIDVQDSAVQVLIVCPTRELVMQETDDLRKLTNFTESIKVVPVFGGSNMERQIIALRKNAKMVIGTPGRLMDHLRRKTLKLNNLKMIVLDEADEMLNMGFKEDIETILKSAPKIRQTVMFSATMPAEIMKLTDQFMTEPKLIKTEAQDKPQAFIKQYYIHCYKDKKLSALTHIFEVFKPAVSIVFCNTIAMTEQLSGLLTAANLPAQALNGDMRQRDRKTVMDAFKKNGGILVATDVAARGIDVKNVDLVINYDLPGNDDYYIHRIGRTGRAGKDGTSFTVVNNKRQVSDLQRLIKKTGNCITEYKIANITQEPAKYDQAKRGDGKKPAVPAANFKDNKYSKTSDKNKDQKSGNYFKNKKAYGTDTKNNKTHATAKSSFKKPLNKKLQRKK